MDSLAPFSTNRFVQYVSLDIPLLPTFRKLKGVIQGIKPPLTLQAIEIGPLQGYLPHQGLDGSGDQPSGLEPATTLGTGRCLLVQGLAAPQHMSNSEFAGVDRWMCPLATERTESGVPNRV